MGLKKVSVIIFLYYSIFLVQTNTYAQADTSEAHLHIAMRMIGNEILESSGDYISRVMPIEKVGKRYKIQFEQAFGLDPLEMASAIHPIVRETKIADNYRVEVELCDTNLLMYGYEIGINDSTELLACARRLQPKDCYVIFITILDKPILYVEGESTQNSFENTLPIETNSFVFSRIVWWGILFIFLIFSVLYLFRKKDQSNKDLHVISLGKFKFDQRKMILSLKGNNTELTSKETDLLELLYKSANSTIEREVILKNVWGDEGDYVGRTLDVFISKLRKKLEADQSVKIINVRGVGYKLILDS